MNGKTTFFLLLTVILLGAFIYKFDAPTEPSPAQLQAQAKRAFQVQPGEVKWLKIDYEKFSAKFVYKDGAWVLARPEGARVKDNVISRLLTKLEGVEKGEIITDADLKRRNMTLKDYGFDAPLARIVLGSDGEARNYLIGRKSFVGDNAYIKESTGKDIITVPATFLEAIPKSMEEVKDRAIFLAKAEDVTKLEVRRSGGFLQAERMPSGSWWLQQPVKTRADAKSISHILSRLFTARIEKFISDDQTELAVYGFSDDSPYVRVWSNLQEFPVKLTLGDVLPDNKDLYYARLEGLDSVFAVSTGLKNLLDFELAGLRERKLMIAPPQAVKMVKITRDGQVVRLVQPTPSEWMMQEPHEWHPEIESIETLFARWTKAHVVKFVELPAEQNTPEARGKLVYAIAFSLDEVLSSERPADATPLVEDDDMVYEVYEKALAQDQVLVHSVQDNTWCEVSPGLIRFLRTDALYYRDRQVMALQSNEVLRVSLKDDEREISAYREAIDQPWKVDAEGNRLDEDRLFALLNRCAQFDATSLIEMDPRELTRFGLETNVTSLTFGLTGESGISRSLLIGDRRPDGGSYAMIRGKDLVFTITAEDRKVLTDDFCTPDKPASETPVEDKGKEPPE
ncbi:MAG: hypothetical protein ACI97B_001225 [Verrucomicrobiales bacterium]